MSKQAKAVACLAGSAFCLMSNYEVIRTSSNTLFQSAYGTKHLATGLAVVPIILAIVLVIYNHVLSQLGPRKTLLVTSLFAYFIVLVCGAFILHGSPFASAILYVHREIYIVILVEQYWSFMNSTLKEDQAKRWNGFFTGMMSVGAVLGGLSVKFLAVKLGTDHLPLFSLIGAAGAVVLSDIAFRIAGEPKQDAGRKQHKLSLGLGAFTESPVLKNIFLIVFATQALSTLLVIAFQTELQAAFPNIDEQSAFSGQFYAMLNGVSFFLQFFISPLVLRFLTPARTQMLIPVIHIGMAAFYFMSPSLIAAGLAYLVFKSVDYSLFRASKEILYIPLSFQARYRAKELIDVLGYRLSKGVTSGGISAVQHFMTVGAGFFSSGSIVACGLWLAAVIPLLRWRPDPVPSNIAA